jgi:hypothetical protein
MKTILVLLLLFSFNPEIYLNKIKEFQKDSYFKSKAYLDEHLLLDTAKESEQWIDVENFDLHLMNWCLFSATQEIRRKNGSNPMRYDERLRNAAQIHSHEMVVHNFYHHVHPKNPQLKTLTQRISALGVINASLGENIHNYPFQNKKISYRDLAREVIESFYKSPHHRQNLLSNSYNSLGCAAMYQYDEKQKHYFLKVTQCFAQF